MDPLVDVGTPTTPPMFGGAEGVLDLTCTPSLSGHLFNTPIFGGAEGVLDLKRTSS